MPRPPRHATDADLLNAVRQQLAHDPTISRAELRARVGGTQSVVSSAMRAALVEGGLLQLRDGEELDPRFGSLIRVPEPPLPLNLRAGVPPDLAQDVSDQLMATQGALDRVIRRIHEAAIGTIDAERADALRLVQTAEARAARAEEYVEALRREAAEANAETERVRSKSAEEQGRQNLEIARLMRTSEDARSELSHAQAVRDTAVAERQSAELLLRDARDQATVLGRDLAAAGARVQELDRQVADLGARLTRAETELAGARAAETEARAAAAAAQATAGAHEGTIRRLEAATAELRASMDEGGTAARKRR